jgi:hypothetical protein
MHNKIWSDLKALWEKYKQLIRAKLTAGRALIKAEYELCKIRLKELKQRLNKFVKSWID